MRLTGAALPRIFIAITAFVLLALPALAVGDDAPAYDFSADPAPSPLTEVQLQNIQTRLDRGYAVSSDQCGQAAHSVMNGTVPEAGSRPIATQQQFRAVQKQCNAASYLVSSPDPAKREDACNQACTMDARAAELFTWYRLYEAADSPQACKADCLADLALVGDARRRVATEARLSQSAGLYGARLRWAAANPVEALAWEPFKQWLRTTPGYDAWSTRGATKSPGMWAALAASWQGYQEGEQCTSSGSYIYCAPSVEPLEDRVQR